MREDEASGQSSEKYDYKFESSFEGDLDYTGLGGSVDASLNFEGSSTDVRDSASKAAMNAVQKQVSRTERTRRQSTRVVTGTEATQDQFESSFTQTVRNSTDHSITIALFQLVQEYVALTVLTDVRLAFSDGGQVDMVPLERLDRLLARCVVDAAQAEFIKKALLAELRDMVDYDRRPVAVLKEIDATRVAFDPEVTSAFTLVNTDGSPSRDIDGQRRDRESAEIQPADPVNADQGTRGGLNRRVLATSRASSASEALQLYDRAVMIEHRLIRHY